MIGPLKKYEMKTASLVSLGLHVGVLGWALVCFTGVWVLALFRDLPRGLSQKALVAAIVLWFGFVAFAAAYLPARRGWQHDAFRGSRGRGRAAAGVDVRRTRLITGATAGAGSR